MGIKLVGTGLYLPEKIVTNDDFAKLVDTSDEWITSRTGIKQRHFADNITTASMGARAAQKAMQNANLTSEDIDMVITTTITPDYFSPSTAYLIANEIGAYNIPAFDVNGACAGFVYAVDIARRYLMDDEYKNILIVSTEMLSKLTDFEDRSTCVLFGDGAGAVVAQKSNSLYSCVLGGDATGVSKLFARGTPPNNPFMKAPYDRMSDGFAQSKGNGIYMDGRDVYKFATKVMPQAVKDACEKAGILIEDLTMVIPHQANRRIIETAAKNLGLPIEKFCINIHDYGNMSSACIPICLAQVQQSFKRGDKICIVGFGAGLTYAAAVIEW